jgi:hypothetical protein
VAEIRFDFLGDTSDLEAAQQRAADGFDEAGAASVDFAKVAKVGLAAAAVAAAAAAAAVVKTSQAVLKLSAAGNRYAKEAKKIGSSAEEIQKVEGAFALLTENGVNAARVIQDFGRNLADARDGTGEAAAELDKLGLSAKDLTGIPIGEQIALVADRFGRLSDSAEVSQVALGVFGRSGRELVPALTAGGDAVRDAVEQIEAAGVMSNTTAAESEALADAVELMGRQFDTLVRGALKPMIPLMTTAVEKIGLFLEGVRSTDVLQNFSTGVVGIAVKMLGLTKEVQAFSDAIKVAEEGGKTQLQIYNEASDAATAQAAKVDRLTYTYKQNAKLGLDNTIQPRNSASTTRSSLRS